MGTPTVFHFAKKCWYLADEADAYIKALERKLEKATRHANKAPIYCTTQKE